MKKFLNLVETALIYAIVFIFLFIIGSIIFNNRPVKKYWVDAEEVEYEEFLDSIIEAESNKSNFHEKKISSTNKVSKQRIIKRNNKTFKVTVTKYNPVREQCDEDPLITADNSKICLNKLNAGKLKWVAVSRDLREHFKYGEKVIIKCDHDPSINGEYEVHDTMNPRYTRTIDLLSPIGDTKGKWKNVEIKKARD